MKTTINTEKAPAAIGPYSQAIKIESSTLLFCSGQIGLDPTSGELVGTTAAKQCRQALENLRNVIIEAGLELDAVVKTTVYLADISDFVAVNEVYGEYFVNQPPARAAIAAAALPKGALVMIDAIAHR